MITLSAAARQIDRLEAQADPPGRLVVIYMPEDKELTESDYEAARQAHQVGPNDTVLFIVYIKTKVRIEDVTRIA